MLAIFIKAINNWEYGIAKALVLLTDSLIVVLLETVILPSMVSEAGA